MTRQREWQIKQEQLGNCITCGKPNDTKYRRCAYHMITQRLAINAWKQRRKIRLSNNLKENTDERIERT